MSLSDELSKLFGAPEPELWKDHLVERAVRRALSDEWVMGSLVRAVVAALRPLDDNDPKPESPYAVPAECGPGDYVKLFGSNPMDAFPILYVSKNRKQLVVNVYFHEQFIDFEGVSDFIKRKPTAEETA